MCYKTFSCTKNWKLSHHYIWCARNSDYNSELTKPDICVTINFPCHHRVQYQQFQNFHISCTPQPIWYIGQPYLYTLWQGVKTPTLFSDSRSHTNVTKYGLHCVRSHRIWRCIPFLGLDSEWTFEIKQSLACFIAIGVCFISLQSNWLQKSTKVCLQMHQLEAGSLRS
jgi:hypothetical protein